MANPEHVERLKRGVGWNEWRESNPLIIPDLSEANLMGENLRGLNLSKANFDHARLGALYIDDWYETNLENADLREAILTHADMYYARLTGADLRKADLSYAFLHAASFAKANLQHAILCGAFLQETYFGEADLENANLQYANLIDTDFSHANLNHCLVFGSSAWGIKLEDAKQANLVITRDTFNQITVENIEVAQLIYMLLNNKKVRDVIDTIARKMVLILGRFTEDRKQVLDAVREELRKKDYIPVIFDFDKPSTRDITETVRTLAYLSRFIIADLSDPRCIPLELLAIVPDLAIPVQPLLLAEQDEFAMFVDMRKKYHWVLATVHYTDTGDLIASLTDKVIQPAEQKAQELENR